MQEGCGLLLTVSVAGKNNVELYDPLTISTPRGPLECRVAGIGPTYVGASIVSTAAANSLRLGAPVSIVVFPEHPDQLQALRSSLEAALSSDGDLHIIDLSIMVEMQREGMKSAQVLMNSMLLLAILLASLSVLNMMLISLRERSREFSLLRAIGATRRQIGLIVTVEGGLYGLLGGALGLFTGAGILWIYIHIAGGNMFGFPDFPVAEAAWNTLEATIPSAILTLLAAPLLTSLSCLPAVRAILNQDNLEELRGIET
jgi:putative ABC transport system permease protein